MPFIANYILVAYNYPCQRAYRLPFADAGIQLTGFFQGFCFIYFQEGVQVPGLGNAVKVIAYCIRTGCTAGV
jgi:hypothetical protein